MKHFNNPLTVQQEVSFQTLSAEIIHYNETVDYKDLQELNKINSFFYFKYTFQI